MNRMYFSAGAAALALFAVPALPAQNVFATTVVAFDDNGDPGAPGFDDPNAALGAPDWASTFAGVYSLGAGGSITLGFAVTIVDGPGADLLIAENPFQDTVDPSRTFAEVCFVEVSSNGVDFARVPTQYTGPQMPFGPFDFVDVGAYRGGFAGVLATKPMPADPTDIVAAGGDPIDLASLQGHPAVVAGLVDLQAITQVRIVDARSGIDTDTGGTLVRDPGTSADLDGVTVLQHAGNQTAGAPRVSVDVPADGRFEITIEDPDGLVDLDPASLRFSLWGVEFPLGALAPPVGTIVQLTPTKIALEFSLALPPAFDLQVSATAQDQSGVRSSAADVRD